MRRVSRYAAIGFAIAAAWAIAIGCDSFEGDSDPRPAAEASTPDVAKPPASEASPPDAALRFCATVDAAFCADFEVGPLETGWLAPPLVHRGLLELTDGGHPSSPAHALRAIVYGTDQVDGGEDLDAGDGGDAALNFRGAGLRRDLVRGGMAGMRVEGDVRIDLLSSGSAGLISVLALGLGTGPTAKTVAVTFAKTGGALIVDDPAVPGHPLFTAFPAPTDGSWFRVRFDANFQAGNVAVYVNGEAVSAQVPGIVSNDLAVVLSAGTFVSAGTGETRISIDNVLVRRF
jgi:hypothetical protein